MEIAVLGIDLGKTTCSVAGLDRDGAVVLRKRVQPMSFRYVKSVCQIWFGRVVLSRNSPAIRQDLFGMLSDEGVSLCPKRSGLHPARPIPAIPVSGSSTESG